MVGAGVVAPGFQQAVSADSGPQPCLQPIAPTSVLNTATAGKISSGTTRTIALPATLPAGVTAVVLQLRANGSKAGELTVAPATASTQRLSALHVLASAWQSSTTWVTNPGTQLAVTYTAVKGAALTATIDAVGYVSAQPCFTGLAPVAAVDTASGVGLTHAGALASGSTTSVTLGGSTFLPGNSGVAPVQVRLSSGTSAATVTITNDASPAATVGSWTLPANGFWTGTYEFPPSVTDNYNIAVTGGAVNVTLTPLGWFADSNAHAIASDAVIDTSTGLGAPKAALASGQTVTFATPSDVPAPAAVVLQVSGAPKSLLNSAATVALWPTGSAAPKNPTVDLSKGVTSTQQVIVPPAAAGSTFSVKMTAGTANIKVNVVGWIPFPPPVNVPVAGVTHVTATTDVTAPVVDPATGDETLTYNGTDKLDLGDVLVQDTSADNPDGYLGIITNIATAPAGTASTMLKSAKTRNSLKLQPATAASTSTTSTNTVITLTQGTLQDALPNADMDSSTMSVDSGDPPPDQSDPLPADTPPPPPAGTTAATTTTATQSSTAPSDRKHIGGPNGPSNATTRSATTNASTTGGSFPGSTNLSCSAGASVKVSTSLKLSAGLSLTGSWRLGHGASANFDAHAGLSGSVALNANAGASCSASATVNGPALPTITFFIGPVPVVVQPVLTLGLNASGSVSGAFKASAGMNIGVDSGVSYANGGFTPYFTPHSQFPVVVDARLGGSLRVSVAPRLDLKIYGVAGPYAKLTAWAKGDVNILAPPPQPWWSASAGIDAEVGLTLNVWLVHASYSTSRTLASWSAGSSPTPYPGPRIATTSLPSGSIGGGYHAQLSASGGTAPLSWYRVSGSLPSGLSMSGSGAITGTPTTTQTSTFTVRAIDAAGYRSPSDQTLSIAVASGPSIVTTSLPDGQVGAGYGVGLQASGGAAPYTWSVVGGGLPPGLGFSSNGTISGTPAAAGSYSFTVHVVDANGAPSPSNATLSINVADQNQPPPSPTVTVSWGARAAASICGGDTSCTYVTISWANFGSGNHTITPYFDGQGNWCGTACANSLVRSGASGSLTGYWAAGYCVQNHGVSATVDGVGSNTISTTQHGC